MVNYRIGYFISAHGFGHAARAAAIMQALVRESAVFEFEIFTTVPDWFLGESLHGHFTYHELTTDVGLAQSSSLNEDISETVSRLGEFLPFRPEQVTHLAAQVRQLGCDCIISDIAPLGIAVAQSAGLPSVLVENFTWDWIYRGYSDEDGRLTPFIEYLEEAFDSADYHVQTEPVCDARVADLVTYPVSREPRSPAAMVRRRLQIPTGVRAILITMGGIPEEYDFVEQLTRVPEAWFIIPGASQVVERQANVILLPHYSDFYHPDLLNACDLVIGKSGYSTVAETYHAGIPFGYVSRSRFREAAVMSRFIHEQMQGMEIAQDEFRDGRWIAQLPELLGMPRIQRNKPNGSHQVASFIHQLLG